jgi:hypothetical protein
MSQLGVFHPKPLEKILGGHKASRPRAAMASTASSRRVVSFPFFHSLRSEHLGSGPLCFGAPTAARRCQGAPANSVVLLLPSDRPGLHTEQ